MQRKKNEMKWNEQKTDASKSKCMLFFTMLSLAAQFDFQFFYISCSSLRIGDGALSYSKSILNNI